MGWNERPAIRRMPEGVPVPWVAARENEREVVQVVRGAPYLSDQSLLLWVTGPADPSDPGAPVLGIMDYDRQRRSFFQWRCQVCAKPMGAHAYMAIFGDVPGLQREPPACFRCMTLAVEHCPGIRRQASMIVKVKRSDIAVYLTATTPDAPGEDEITYEGPPVARQDDPAAGPVAYGHAKAAVRNVRGVWRPEEFGR